ncbi:hypothetical protein [Rugamonas sp.]|uniref:hypothetical protein n=1 Tax=Rugamonas sp. TaxID=1926287 RepID=UPI0025CC406E|nr:hypothetical protein [Rugamonas sp.]
MNRPFFVIVSFTVSTIAALAVSGSLHAQALSAPPPPSCAAPQPADAASVCAPTGARAAS